ncbi:MAG: amino acid adenylation domain-containing protein [Candidatus Aminicenantes bacterium]|nr:amino acid adenylation domain-containing protein [Candidatus Aminicenantes bacterium]
MTGLLIEKGVLADDIVSIMMERSIDLIIGIMGILKAGAAYLPIDADYPKERIDYMLKDSAAKIILTAAGCVFNFHHSSFIIHHSNHLAYIIYTSGSTGKPKGILTTHANVIRVVRNTNYIELTEKDRILQLSNYAFDGSVFDIYGALLNGATLVLVDRETAPAADRLAVLIRWEQVTVFFVTTALFNTLVDLELTCLKNIRKVLFGGERVSTEHSRKALAALGEGKIIHVYGPTETTVYATYYFIVRIAGGAVTIPIGKPIANTTIYIMDKYINPVPLGIPGEIHIGGEGVARGYLNNPELTAEKFNRSYRTNKTYICYKTGDLARRLDDGNIEFLGRIDQQVKIRGFRIELGEIESRLLKHGGIKEAVVIDRQDRGDKYLCTYIVPLSHPAPGAAELKTYLSGSLPDYMIPSYFIEMEKIPLNPNGKIDRKALPEPGVGDAAKEYMPPRNAVEKKLAEIWAEVLKLQSPVGIIDNFFDLGGHSLNATVLTARMHKAFNVKIPLKEFLQGGCIREVAKYINGAVKDQFTAVEPMEKKEYYPLSPAQKRMYLLHQMDEGSAAYNIPAVMTLEGALDTNQLKKVFINLIQRHESLRTSFTAVDEEPVQRIHEHVEFEIDMSGAREWSPDKSFIRSFDLAKAPLMRVGLIRNDENEHILMMDIHHIIADGTSLGLLYKEMMALYRGNDLPDLKITYKDYAAWQNNQKNKGALNGQETFWLEQFAGEIPTLNLPTDYPRPLMQSFEGSRVHFELDSEETELLKKLARDRGATLYMTLLAACNTWFSKLSGEEDIVIGTPIAGRRHAELHDIVGMLVGTLPLRNYPAPGKTFTDFLEEVKERTLEALRNQDYPFENLVEKLAVTRDTSRNPVFDVMFGFQNMEMPAIDVPGLTLRPYEYEIKTAKFDLNLAGRENGDQLTFSLEYSTKLFKEETIRKFAGYFKNIIHAIRTNPGVGIADMEIIDHEEKEQILAISTGPTEPIDPNETIHGWFEKIVPENEHKTALVFGDGRITYGELNRRANRLACLLAGKGVGPGAVVGLMVERSFEIVIGMLAIMKAGGAYLPIDPRLPGQRKRHMIEDGSISLLLTNYDIGENAGDIPGNIRLIDLRSECRRGGDGENLPAINKGSDLLYVLFTSGSTGRPKGVMLEHTNLVNLFKFQQKYTAIDTTKVLQFATISFDVSFQEIFTTLLAGGELYLMAEETRTNIQALFKVIGENKIKTLFLPMSFLKLIFSQDDYIEIFPGSVQHIVTAGEQVVVDDRFRNYLKRHHIYLHNHYGPAETHVVTTYTMNPAGDIPGFPPIGKPVMNTGIYILDKGKHLQPAGIAGELYVGGLQVGRGYRGREEETREKFIDFHHSSFIIHHSNLYRTGDLARRLADGNIEFLGRIDHQVKIRGIRVEPGEIENRLKKIVFIEDAVVVVKQQEAGDKYLCAYVVLDTARQQDISELRNILSVDLPDYMIPAYFVPVDKIPLTPSGKIDRRALPEPELKAGEKYTAPRDEIETKMVAIWSRILGVQQEMIGIEDNFFQLGGHSLKATLMASRIHKEFNVKLPLADIFKRPTVRGLAEYIRNTGTSAFISIKAAPRSDYYTLSSPQRRLYILQQMDKTSTAYNLPAVLELEGTPGAGKLEESFKKLIIRHESLRTSFHMVDEQPVQEIHEPGGIEFALQYADASCGADSLSRQISLLIRAFDLAAAPLFRVGLLKLAEQKHILVVDMHHIISDGTSLGVLIQEFMALYSGAELPPLRIHYKDYAVYQGSGEIKELMRQQAEYWLKEYREEPPVLELPLDYPRPAVQSFAGTIVRFEVGAGEFKALIQLAREENATLYMVLMAAYSILLSRLSGQQEIVIGAPIAGRRHVELASIIGMFVNTLALRIYPEGNKTFKEFLAQLKQKTLEAFENQEYPFEDLVEQVVVKRDTGRNPLFDAAFLLQNQEVPTLEIPGLKLKPYPYETQIAKFDLTLSAVEIKSEGGDDKLRFYLEYCTQLFNGETIERFIVYFKNIIRGILEHKTGRIFQLEIIPEAEKKRLLYDFNNTQVDYPSGKTIHQLFAEQAEKTPDRIALVGANRHLSVCPVFAVRPVGLSYRQLNEQSDRLTGLLIEKGVLADDIVGIMMERSIDLIIGILGILKSGGAYLPIDPDYPQERIDYMLKESAAKITLTATECAFNFHHSSFIIHHSSHLAYIMYTSGSTGQPKGVMVTHRNVVRLVMNTNFVSLNEDTRILQTGAPVFDATTFEIWGSLLNSGQLVLVDKGVILNAHRLAGALASHRINTLWLSAPLFNQLMQENIELFAPLRYLLVGGDVLSPGHINRVKSRFPGLKIINGYGPTENTTFSTTYLIEKEFEYNIPIGRPIANSTAYIYDKYNRLTPIGAAGELVVGGDGVACGYLNNPELTAEKFNRSYRTNKTYICYKTGDLARWLPNGTIQFQGRVDQQVKIRGFRIELGEIENRLLKHKDIKEAVVIDRDLKGEKTLCAYFVPVNAGPKENTADSTELREFLAQVLPDYMIPTFFVRLEKIPLTPNGKVNRSALPEPGIQAGDHYIAPGNPLEEELVEIWAGVLGVEKTCISVDVNLFELGANSLKIITVNNRLREHFNRDIPAAAMFRYSTIRMLAQYLQDGGRKMDDVFIETKHEIHNAVDRGKNRMRKKMRKNQATGRIVEKIG